MKTILELFDDVKQAVDKLDEAIKLNEWDLLEPKYYQVYRKGGTGNLEKWEVREVSRAIPYFKLMQDEGMVYRSELQAQEKAKYLNS